MTFEQITKIEIQLGDSDVGSTARVTTKGIFRSQTQTYACHHADPVMGARWINSETGLAPPRELEHRINDAAQAAARLSTHSEMTAPAERPRIQ